MGSARPGTLQLKTWNGTRSRSVRLATVVALLSLFGGTVLTLAAEPSGQEPGPVERAAASTEPHETVFTLAVKGGWLMIPIAACSVVILTWTIERLVSLRRARVQAPQLLEEIFSALPPRGHAARENVAEAVALCESSGTMVGRVLLEGVERIHRDEAHVETVLEEATDKELHVLKRKLRPFEVCVAVAPLLGLLGTIFGMIRCFERATLADTAARAETLANGIYEALVTTAAGLCVAIPGLLLHHYFLGRGDRVQDLLEDSATEFMDHYYGATASGRLRGSTGVPAEKDGAPSMQRPAVLTAEPEGDGRSRGPEA